MMFRERIQEKYDQLSPRFRSLADFILENTLDVGFVTATELARRVGVDPATVVRFSQDLGYSGYRELSREIKQYINQELALRYQKGAPEAEGIESNIALAIDELSDRILSLKVDAGSIRSIAEAVNQASRVFVVSKADGYGLAGLWATYLQFIGIEAQVIQAEMGKAALLLRDAEASDVVFAIALGFDPDAEIGLLLAAAREQGLKTIALTTSPTLQPARQADISFTATPKPVKGYPFFTSLTALLDIIWQTLVMMKGAAAHETIGATIGTLDKLVAAQEKAPAYDFEALQRLWEQP